MALVWVKYDWSATARILAPDGNALATFTVVHVLSLAVMGSPTMLTDCGWPA
jgi:hypothetical protein